MAFSNTTSLVPDYNAETKDIYTDLACQLIENGGKLGILGFCCVISGDFDLPSWVSDWTATHGPKPFLHQALDSPGSLDRLYHATKNTEFDGSIDKEEVPRYFNSGRDSDIAHQWILAALGRWSKYITGCSRQEAFAHTLCADVDVSMGDPNACSQLGKRPCFIPLPEHEDHLGIFRTPCPEIRDATMGRFLFFTEKGYMGLAPYTAEVGEKVCLLKGAQLPIILRPEGAYWEVVGECYIHGIKDGEGWDKMISESDSSLSSFEIR